MYRLPLQVGDLRLFVGRRFCLCCVSEVGRSATVGLVRCHRLHQGSQPKADLQLRRFSISIHANIYNKKVSSSINKSDII